MVIDPHEAGENGLDLAPVPQVLVPLNMVLLLKGVKGKIADVLRGDAPLAEGVLHHVRLHRVDAEIVQSQPLLLHLLQRAHQTVCVLGHVLIGPDHVMVLDHAGAYGHAGEQHGSALRLALIDDLQGAGGGFPGI